MAWYTARSALAALTLLATGASPGQDRPTPEPVAGVYAGAREEMVRQVRRELRHAGLREDDRLRAILEVIGRLPRELYVPPDQRASAYRPAALPIGHGQTISDAFIMAYMTRRLDLRPRDRVLEIGTGSGYQAAILGSLVDQVYTIEIVPELAERAAATLRQQGFRNVRVRQGDGYAGWPEAAPFDAIIVTAGAARIPPALFAQLRPGGIMIIPLGPHWADRRMTLVRKTRGGRAQIRACGWVMFVPFVGAAQEREPGAPPVRRERSTAHCRALLGQRSNLVVPAPGR